ncbi:MAG: hypothetical protein K6T83_20900 [Alicyclobacillus sp.]|nr:hypothetical protein [Alicyclobacillus sp.]
MNKFVSRMERDDTDIQVRGEIERLELFLTQLVSMEVDNPEENHRLALTRSVYGSPSTDALSDTA